MIEIYFKSGLHKTIYDIYEKDYFKILDNTFDDNNFIRIDNYVINFNAIDLMYWKEVED